MRLGRLHPRDPVTSLRPCLQTPSQRELGFSVGGTQTFRPAQMMTALGQIPQRMAVTP